MHYVSLTFELVVYSPWRAAEGEILVPDLPLRPADGRCDCVPHLVYSDNSRGGGSYRHWTWSKGIIPFRTWSKGINPFWTWSKGINPSWMNCDQIGEGEQIEQLGSGEHSGNGDQIGEGEQIE